MKLGVRILFLVFSSTPMLIICFTEVKSVTKKQSKKKKKQQQQQKTTTKNNNTNNLMVRFQFITNLRYADLILLRCYLHLTQLCMTFTENVWHFFLCILSWGIGLIWTLLPIFWTNSGFNLKLYSKRILKAFIWDRILMFIALYFADISIFQKSIKNDKFFKIYDRFL